MKVVDGKFGKQKQKDMTLQEKLALTMASMLDELYIVDYRVCF